MRTILFVLLFIASTSAFSQNPDVRGTIIFSEERLPFPGVTVELFKNDEVFAKTQTDFDGKYYFKNVPAGTYNLRLTNSGVRDKVIRDFIVNKEENNSNILYPDPCVETKKICPKNHSNNIIPIVYGFPSKKTMKKAEKGKIKLGGCDPSFCEKWYCKIHDISF